MNALEKDQSEGKRGALNSLWVALGGLIPFGVTLFGGLFLLETRLLTLFRPDTNQQISAYIAIVGVFLGCTVAFLLNLQTCSQHKIAFRATVTLSALVSGCLLIGLTSELAIQLNPDYGSYDMDEAIFIGVPLILVSCILLTLSLHQIKSTTARGLVVIGYWATTVFAQILLLKDSSGNTEEAIWKTDSLLVALVGAIWLCAWGATQFSQH